MKDGFLFVGLMVAYMIMIMAIGFAGDYAMRHQNSLKCECK